MLNPSKELAYVIGVLLGDAAIYYTPRSGYTVELRAKDKDFIEAFRRNMGALTNKLNKITRISDGRYRIRYRNKKFYMWYKKQTLDTLRFYIEYDMETMCSFLKGIFDSDGSSGKIITVSSTNLKLLKYIRYLLGRLDIDSYISIDKEAGSNVNIANKKGVRQKRLYRLIISKHSSRRKFMELVGFNIHRKSLAALRHL